MEITMKIITKYNESFVKKSLKDSLPNQHFIKLLSEHHLHV